MTSVNKKIKTKRRIIVALTGVLLVTSVAVLMLYLNRETTRVVFNDNIIFEYGDELSNESLKEKIINVKESKYKTLELTDLIDLSKVSRKNDETAKPITIDYTMIVDGKSQIQKLTYEVLDTKAPILEGVKDVRTEEGVKFDFNNIFSSVDPIDGKTELIIEGIETIDYSKVGTVYLVAVGEDKHGNRSTQDFKLTITAKPSVTKPEPTKPQGNTSETYTDSKPANLSEGNLILVNKKNHLPSDWAPSLVVIPTGYAVSDGYRATKETSDAFVSMVDAMHAETGLWMYVTSSYRSYETQRNLYNNYVRNHGQKEADRFSAKPGKSEHQTGLAIDIVSKGGSMWTFGETKQSQWLKTNAHKYGFIIRYQEGKESITGYMPEAWHVRYLGKSVASDVYSKNVTYEEYLGRQ